jgi:predicted metal-dependent phosphoesterase TrpH
MNAGAYNSFLCHFFWRFFHPTVFMLNVDLHCHSNVSDGVLSPAALAARAKANGVDVWALTDHDELDGLSQAREAAAELEVSQPALSKSIKALEKSLGVPLLERGRFGVSPTAYGQALMQHGQVVEAELRHAQLELDAAQRRLARSETLAKEGASAVQELDDDRARMRSAPAALKATQAPAAAVLLASTRQRPKCSSEATRERLKPSRIRSRSS